MTDKSPPPDEVPLYPLNLVSHLAVALIQIWFTLLEWTLIIVAVETGAVILHSKLLAAVTLVSQGALFWWTFAKVWFWVDRVDESALVRITKSRNVRIVIASLMTGIAFEGMYWAQNGLSVALVTLAQRDRPVAEAARAPEKVAPKTAEGAPKQSPRK